MATAPGDLALLKLDGGLTNILREMPAIYSEAAPKSPKLLERAIPIQT